MLADRNDDLSTAIDDDGGACPLEPGTEGDLNDRDGQERNKKENQGSHVIPRQVSCWGRLASTSSVKFAFSEPYKNVYYAKNDGKFCFPISIQCSAET
jgi:hypothetical protein